MKRYQMNGMTVKRLRKDRDRGSTQKELAHEARISERLLRLIENANGRVSRAVLERLARALGVESEALLMPLGPPSISLAMSSGRAPVASTRQLWPRFDTDHAHVVKDAAELFKDASNSHRIIVHVRITLNAETSAYADELLEIMESVTWERGSLLHPIEGRGELRMRERIRQLLVLLKGNDVWVFATRHIKHYPESYEVVVTSDRMEGQTIVAFAPPGEYGEDYVEVPVDNGHPWIFDSALARRVGSLELSATQAPESDAQSQ